MRTRMERLMIFAPLAIVAMALFVIVGGEIVKHLWNWLLPTLFGWPRVSFWQALGLLALCRILVGGFGLHGSGRSSRAPEERERIHRRMREKFGFGPAAAESNEP